MKLHEVGLDEKPCFAAAGAAYHQHVLVPRRFWVLGTAGHGEAFCPGQRDVPIGNRVYVGCDIRRRAP